MPLGQAFATLGDGIWQLIRSENIPWCRYEQATQLLMEVVKQVPNCTEPYKNLAFIHEEQDDLDKAVAFLLVAGRTAPKVIAPLM